MKVRSIFSTLFTIIAVLSLVSALLLSSSCGVGGKAGEVDSTLGLKDFYKDYFPMGVAVTPYNLTGESGELIKKHFNSLTAENDMKPQLIQPQEGNFNWEAADKIVDFAVANGMKVRGHTLCWDTQTGKWMFEDKDGKPASKELALKRLEEHIKAVVTRYKGKIYAWDVLNEIITDDPSPTKIYQDNWPWIEICGTDFVPLIFKWAHEADPDCQLFYNDYNTENPIKREKIYNFLKELLDQGVPIHGVGLQAHWNINNPSEENLRASIDRFSSLGLKVQFTELDIAVYAGRRDTIGIGFTPEREQKQIDQYNMVFKVFREKKDKITGITFWNVSDRGSWLDRRNPGGKAYPLLFDTNLKPKKAFWEVVKF